MPDIEDGQSVEIKGSARDPYVLRNIGGVYSCTCPAWMHQSIGIERRTCKHLRQYRGESAETERLGSLPVRTVTESRPRTSTSKSSAEVGSGDSVAPAILLAHSWTSDMDPAGWWMSEKLDGVRAYWNGKFFISRLGNQFMAPDWFTAGLPEDTHLDGELWLSRGAFQSAVSIVRRQDRSDHWKRITFMVFDAPTVEGGFEQRLAFIQSKLENLQHKYATAHSHVRCNSVDHLKEELARVQSLGGEGLMLRKPGSPYEAGRSMTLLKVKTFHDAEAVVVAHLPGTGKHKGRLGALSVKLPDGTVFSVGSGFTDAEREKPPSIGSIITFRYQELTDGGVPRFPTFLRVRTDLETFETNLERLPSEFSKDANAKPVDAQQTNSASDLPNSNASAQTNVRRFEYPKQPGTTWTISTEGLAVITVLTRSAEEQRTTKTFETVKQAQDYVELQIAQRRNRGFVEL